MDYQQVLLSGPTAVGLPGPLPAPLIGNLTAGALADLTWATTAHPEFAGYGYWPVTDTTTFDPGSQMTGDWTSVTLDAPNKAALGVRAVVANPNAPGRVVSKRDFRNRFAADEQGREVIFRQTVYEKTATELTDPANQLYLEARIAYDAAQEVGNYNLDDPQVAQYVGMLRTAGVLASDDRVTAVLA